ncbi:uncharacterized protein At4g02000-like [Juglans regia]|uniref:Uncharacterized protein At4g02000-like n=1 Tax=Juglans regia TaxID=51240 RepID=A0A6P9EEU7_JUGRE|nr:uncharacterized protein At4g02000-like [Juglans regia]
MERSSTGSRNHPNESLLNLTLDDKLISMKPLNKNTFHAIIRAVWCFVIGLIVEDIDTNMFMFTFPKQQDKDRILANSPWNFKGFHMVLSHCPPELSINEIALNFSVFWIQIHGLPMDMPTNKNAERIGQVFGNLIKSDRASIFGVTLRRYLRLKVELKVEQPLLEGFELARPNGEVRKILIQYERLSDFCYGCGRLGHIVQTCPIYMFPPDFSKYGPWMRVENTSVRRND